MEYLHTEMVVCNGVICEWGSIKHFAQDGDEVILADEEEIAWFKFVNNPANV